MKVLVTGATGLLGTRAVTQLARHHEVWGLVRRTPNSPVKGVRYIEADLATAWSSAALPPQLDAVVHLAQSAQPRAFPAAGLEINAVIVHSTAILLDYAHRAGARHFVLASTGGLYASSLVPLTEDTPLDLQDGPLGCYFAAKYAAELIASQYRSLMHTVVLRPFFIYGPGQREDMFIPRVIASVRKGEGITLQGQDGVLVNPIHVDDAAAAVGTALSRESSLVANIAGPTVISLREMAEHLGARVGRPPVFIRQDGEARSLIGDTTVMCEQLTAPRIDVRSGLDALLGSASVVHA